MKSTFYAYRHRKTGEMVSRRESPFFSKEEAKRSIHAFAWRTMNRPTDGTLSNSERRALTKAEVAENWELVRFKLVEVLDGQEG